jgi:hypothetical protein
MGCVGSSYQEHSNRPSNLTLTIQCPGDRTISVSDAETAGTILKMLVPDVAHLVLLVFNDSEVTGTLQEAGIRDGATLTIPGLEVVREAEKRRLVWWQREHVRMVARKAARGATTPRLR